VRLTLQRRESLTGVALAAPFSILLSIFLILPIARAAWTGFHSMTRGGSTSFVGLANYEFLLTDPLFHRSLIVTAIFAGASVAGVLALSLLYALWANGTGKGHLALRTLLFLPALTPLAVAPILWRFLLHPSGLVNSLLAIVGIPPVNWLTGAGAALLGMTIANVWYLASLFMIVVLTGLRAIPQEVHDAARCDGAGRLAQLRWISIPLLRPSILVVVVLCATLTIKSPVLPLLLTSGGPDGATRILSLFIYETGFRFFRLELASAASILMLLLLVSTSVIVLRILRPR
jgi:multiple sugar transport system permease protein